MPKWSAVVSGTPDAAEFGINADHRNMTKFSNTDNEDFKKLSCTLELMVQKSSSKVEANWALEARMKQGNQLYYSGTGFHLDIVIFYCGTQVFFDCYFCISDTKCQSLLVDSFALIIIIAV